MSPNPGSDEALAAGCRCPVLDNAHGRGAYREPDGTPQFWINSDCPLHGAAPVEPPPAPGWCVVHEHYKWCHHTGGVMGPTGYEAPAPAPAASPTPRYAYTGQTGHPFAPGESEWCFCRKAVPGMWTSGYDATRKSFVRHAAAECVEYVQAPPRPETQDVRRATLEEAAQAITPATGAQMEGKWPVPGFCPFLGESGWDLLARAATHIRALADAPAPAASPTHRCPSCDDTGEPPPPVPAGRPGKPVPLGASPTGDARPPRRKPFPGPVCRICGHPPGFHLDGKTECLESWGAPGECQCPLYIPPPAPPAETTNEKEPSDG